MIRKPKRDERRQIILLIELIMQDMEITLEHIVQKCLYAMLEEAMLDDRFATVYKPWSISTREKWLELSSAIMDT